MQCRLCFCLFCFLLYVSSLMVTLSLLWKWSDWFKYSCFIHLSNEIDVIGLSQPLGTFSYLRRTQLIDPSSRQIFEEGLDIRFEAWKPLVFIITIHQGNHSSYIKRSPFESRWKWIWAEACLVQILPCFWNLLHGMFLCFFRRGVLMFIHVVIYVGSILTILIFILQ